MNPNLQPEKPASNRSSYDTNILFSPLNHAAVRWTIYMTISTSHFYKSEMEDIKIRNPSQALFRSFDIYMYIYKWFYLLAKSRIL